MPNTSVVPPKFVMWKSMPLGQTPGWLRQWYGNELDPHAVFTVRGVGICEPMFNANVHRPIGTGDWLIMFFHKAARLERFNLKPTATPNTLILWPPGVEQFYSWGQSADIEPHSWMHLEGSWVGEQVEDNRIPTAIPILLETETLITNTLQFLMNEMNQHERIDRIILQNLFQNWARSLARYLQTRDPQHSIPESLLKIRAYLDDHFTEATPLNELTRIARMSRSHLCHQFRNHFGTTISSYVVRKRMSIAQRLLYDLHIRPGEIAKIVGYPDIYQFSKQFKKTFGVSPTQYRNQHKIAGEF